MTHRGSPADDRLEKPSAVIEMASPVLDVFLVLKARFGIGDYFPLNLARIDTDPEDFLSINAVAALTMRRLQSLWFLAQPATIARTTTLIGLLQQTTSQFELLQRHCDAQEEEVIDNATTALDLAFEGVTDLLAQHQDALGGKLDVELGPTAVPNDLRSIRLRRRR